MKQDNKHLPMYGVGPLVVIIMAILTIIGITLSELNFLDSGIIKELQIPMFVIGVILILSGIILWLLAVIGSKIETGVKENKLIKDGVYRYTRNPIYEAFIFLFSGALLIMNNLWLLILPPIFHILLTVFMIMTEEKWLTNLYKDEYIEYKKETNRCFPWFPRIKK